MIKMVKPFLVQAGSAQFAFVDPPPVLYKFFREEAHADALAMRGEVRIGTLYDFRAQEGLDPIRGDAGEGQFTITLESAHPATITAENAPWYLKNFIVQSGMPILSHGGTINAVGNYPDSYVFCASAVRTSALAAGYGPYCVRIHHVVGFFTALSRHLTDDIGIASKAHLGAFGWCQYEDRSIKATSVATEIPPQPVAFIKKGERGDELEVRAVWYPAEQNPSARLVTCPELMAFCSRVP
jgi:hypothetical protein